MIEDTSRASGAPIRLGMLTPSSNTVLEPMLARMAAGLPGCSLHFSRFKVTEIALSEQALGQFADDGMIAAAELLADAKVDAIAWNGTSAGWLGFERDERLCAAITAATGLPATSSILAFREVFQRTGARRIGLVTPYTDDVQARIVANWAAAGFFCDAERHLGLRNNFSFAEVPEDMVEAMVDEVIAEGCDAVAIVCTNMRGAALADRMERAHGVPIYDSVSVTLWKSMILAGMDPAGLSGWGSLFGANEAVRRSPAAA